MAKGRIRDEAQSALLTEKIKQDLIAGLSTAEIAKAHEVSRVHVNKIRRENLDEVTAKNQEILQDRQAKIDKFLEDETQDLLDICRMTSEGLKAALTKKKQATKDFITTEITLRDGKKTIKTVAVHDVDTAMRLYQQSHSILAMFQKNATD